MDKKQREERRRQEDIALQRGLLWVAGAVVLEALLVFVNRCYINYPLTDAGMNLFLALDAALRVLRVVAAVAAVAAFGYAAWRLNQKKSFGIPLVAALALAAVAVCAHVTIKFKSSGISMLFWLVVAWAVLALVYYLYQREFFLGAAACGMSVLGLWFVRYSSWKESILLLIAVAVVLGAVLWLKKNGGAVSIGKQTFRFLPQTASYTVPLATCGASVAALLAAMVMGGMAAYYLIFVMVAWLFALFVYYTVKLM